MRDVIGTCLCIVSCIIRHWTDCSFVLADPTIHVEKFARE